MIEKMCDDRPLAPLPSWVALFVSPHEQSYLVPTNMAESVGRRHRMNSRVGEAQDLWGSNPV